MIKIAIIGTGGMANAHAEGFGKIEECSLTACADIVPGKARDFADRHGIPAAYEDNLEMLNAEELQAVTIVTADQHHAAPALQCIERGLHVMCEKPLSNSLEDARMMARAAEERGVLTAVNFSYRDNPATQMARKLMDEGTLGRITHVEGSYLQSWLTFPYWGDWHTNPAWQWRLSTRHGSTGALGDIGVHLFDLATFIVGDMARVTCLTRTFDKGVQSIGEYVFDANDSMVALAEFERGAIGTLDVSRMATGHRNTVALRVWGDQGALDLNLDRPQPDTLRLCAGVGAAEFAWESISCPPTPSMYRRFIDSIISGQQAQTSFAGAAKVQACLNAGMLSAESGCPVEVS